MGKGVEVQGAYGAEAGLGSLHKAKAFHRWKTDR